MEGRRPCGCGPECLLLSVCSQMLGLAKGCLESVLPYIHDRTAFGQPVADFQVDLLCMATPSTEPVLSLLLLRPCSTREPTWPLRLRQPVSWCTMQPE